MGTAQDKMVCRTPAPGRQATTIARWKYDAVRRAILDVLPGSGEGVPFRRLPELVAGQLSPAERSRLGSVSWYTTTVKLELEVQGEIERVPGSKPQRLLRRIGEQGISARLARGDGSLARLPGEAGPSTEG
jgi:hypothetical protein